MKIKGVIEDLRIKKSLKNKRKKKKTKRKKRKKKNDCKNSKNLSSTFSGVVVGIVGSVHFWIVSWSGLYFSRSIGPFLCSRY